MDEHGVMCKTIGKKHRQSHPAPGRVEHDAQEIWENTASLLLEITKDTDPAGLLGLGIAINGKPRLSGIGRTARPPRPPSYGRMCAPSR